MRIRLPWIRFKCTAPANHLTIRVNTAASELENLSDSYHYQSAHEGWSDGYLWPIVKKVITKQLPAGASIIDVGCGNGAIAGLLAEMGYRVTGIDASTSGIQVAQEAYPLVHFLQRSAYDDLAAELGQFDCVLSLEVVEHCFWPGKLSNTMFKLLRPGGLVVMSTPYHGYLKNLALAVAGKFDSHWSPLWDGGHIKFWSRRTLSLLLEQTGFTELSSFRVGRIPPLAKSMVFTGSRAA